MKLSAVKDIVKENKEEVDKDEFSRFEDVIEISEELDKDLSSTKYEPKVVKRANPILIIEIANELEYTFIESLLVQDKNNIPISGIEVCIRLDTVLKPIGYIDFTFNNMMKIKSYNSELYVAIKRDSELELSLDMILNLP